MDLLLDTHVFLWYLFDDQKLETTASQLISDRTNRVYVSPVAFWEIAIKVSIQKLKLNTDYESFIEFGMNKNQFIYLPISLKHTSRLLSLPQLKDHRDPFDRLLVAQALVEGFMLISADARLDSYSVPRVFA